MRPHRRQPTRLPRPWDSSESSTAHTWRVLGFTQTQARLLPGMVTPQTQEQMFTHSHTPEVSNLIMSLPGLKPSSHQCCLHKGSSDTACPPIPPRHAPAHKRYSRNHWPNSEVCLCLIRQYVKYLQPIPNSPLPHPRPGPWNEGPPGPAQSRGFPRPLHSHLKSTKHCLL